MILTIEFSVEKNRKVLVYTFNEEDWKTELPLLGKLLEDYETATIHDVKPGQSKILLHVAHLIYKLIWLLLIIIIVLHSFVVCKLFTFSSSDLPMSQQFDQKKPQQQTKNILRCRKIRTV